MRVHAEKQGNAEPPLIQAMLCPDFYPHRPKEVELRQTHISYVFLADEYVYKIKKPVRFTFLDYSTLDQRRFFCEEEVRLNRRLASEIYVGVFPVLEEAGNFFLGEESARGGDPTIVEYAVKMRRLPADRMLNHLVANEKVGKNEVSAIGKKLASFHAGVETGRAGIYGSPEAVWRRISDNFQDTERFVGHTISEKQYRCIKEYSLGFFESNRALFEGRVREGRVREGHGDLRAEHIALTDDIVIFDCIEFSEALRYCDVASELAFLAMDLEFLGASFLSEHLVAVYREASADNALTALMPFYKCYRAYVRGKVGSLKSRDPEVPEREREVAGDQARRYFALAQRYAKGLPAPALIIVCGLAGTGKSTLARLIRDRSGFPLLASDVTRKRLAGLRATEHVPESFNAGIYSDSFTDRTYYTLLTMADACLARQKGVIVDATFKDSRHRQVFVDLAERRGVPVLFVECRAEKEEILRRLDQRAQDTREVSDATREIYLRQRDEFMPLTEITEGRRLIVNTDTDLLDGVDNLDPFLS